MTMVTINVTAVKYQHKSEQTRKRGKMTDNLEPVSADLYRRRVQNGDLRKLSGVDWSRGK